MSMDTNITNDSNLNIDVTFGGKKEVAEMAVQKVKERHPKLKIAGVMSPPFKPLHEMDHASICAEIRTTDPDLLFVSFGCPKQEKWIAMNYKRAGAPVTIGVGAETQWKPFCTLINRPDLATDPRFATNPARLNNREALEAELKPIIAAHPRSYWRDRMAELGLPSAPVNGLDDTLGGPQVTALGTVQTVDHPQLGPIRLMRSPLQVDGTYLPIHRAPPMLGQHSDEILRTLAGLNDNEIAALRASGTIG